MFDYWPDERRGIFDIEARIYQFFISFQVIKSEMILFTLQAASIVLHKAPLLGSQRKQ